MKRIKGNQSECISLKIRYVWLFLLDVWITTVWSSLQGFKFLNGFCYIFNGVPNAWGLGFWAVRSSWQSRCACTTKTARPGCRVWLDAAGCPFFILFLLRFCHVFFMLFDLLWNLSGLLPHPTHTLHVNVSVHIGHTSDGKRCVCTVSLCDVFGKMTRWGKMKTKSVTWVLLYSISYKRDHVNPMRLRSSRAWWVRKQPIIEISWCLKFSLPKLISHYKTRIFKLGSYFVLVCGCSSQKIAPCS